MNWIEALYQTYVSCESMAGVSDETNDPILMPICHTTQNAQIEVVLDGDGNFRHACLLNKEEAKTLIPCTEESGGRTSSPRPHPLHDTLQYTAYGWAKHLKGEKAKKKKGYVDTNKQYLDQLNDWCSSPYRNDKVNAVYNYVKKGVLINDLSRVGILKLDSDGFFLERSSVEKTSQKEIRGNIVQEDSFIRFKVEADGDLNSKLWKDINVIRSWTDYYLSKKKSKVFCHVMGSNLASTSQHPSKIRNTGDKAKLLSANDSANFTYRGRFISAEQSASVSYEVSQKSHAALRWLIEKQGYNNDGLAIVVWSTNGAPLPKLTDDILDWEGGAQDDSDLNIFTDESLAIKLRKCIAGYETKLDDNAQAIVMAVDSAQQGQGRLSIVLYRQLKGSEFLDRIGEWYRSCAWKHSYKVKEVASESKKKKFASLSFFGAPSPVDIAKATYGKDADAKLIRSTIKRILPCIIDGPSCHLPSDLLRTIARRVSNREGTSRDGRHWEWEKALSIACALFKRHMFEKGVEFKMALDTERTSRDYLYGRLLAVADVLEERALSSAGDNRSTNAARLMARFADRPFSTWRILHNQLLPYRQRLGPRSRFFLDIIQEIEAKFLAEEFMDDKPLSAEYLLGYYCQREVLKFRKQPDEPSMSPEV